jgi:hypothetical protein
MLFPFLMQEAATDQLCDILFQRGKKEPEAIAIAIAFTFTFAITKPNATCGSMWHSRLDNPF